MSAATQFDLIGQFSLQHGGAYSLKIKLVDEAGDILPLDGDVVATIFAGRTGGELLAIDCPIVADEADLSLTADQILTLPVGRLAYVVRQLVTDVEPRLLIGGQCDVLPVGAGVVRARDSVVSLQLNSITVSCQLVANASGGGGLTEVTTDDITDMSAAGRAIATAADAAAQLNILGAVSANEINDAQFVSYLDQGLIDGSAQTQARANIDAARSTHTHALSDLTQSSATSGQVPTWNGSVWAPATPSSGGGMAIGGAITSAANNRILQSDASGNLAQSTWYFDALAFAAIMPSRQSLRSTKGGGGFVTDDDGGIVIGRTDDGPQAFIGYYGPGGGVTVHQNSAFRWGNNINDLRSSDTHLSRRSAQVLEGAALANRASTVAGAPSAADFVDCTVIFTDSSRGRRPCYSDGTNWRFYSDDAILS